jgi:hypothetical protein
MGNPFPFSKDFLNRHGFPPKIMRFPMLLILPMLICMGKNTAANKTYIESSGHTAYLESLQDLIQNTEGNAINSIYFSDFVFFSGEEFRIGVDTMSWMYPEFNKSAESRANLNYTLIAVTFFKDLFIQKFILFGFLQRTKQLVSILKPICALHNKTLLVVHVVDGPHVATKAHADVVRAE